MTTEPLPSPAALILPYGGILPELCDDISLCSADISILGRVRIGARSTIGSQVVIRGDGHTVSIGDDFCIGTMSTVHIAHDVLPTIIGNHVSVGHDTVVHACQVGDGCVIQDRVVVLDGSMVENGVLIAHGAVVFPRSVLKEGFVYSGSPARPTRALKPRELEESGLHLRQATTAFPCGSKPATRLELAEFSTGSFVADTASISGKVVVGEHASVMFGCRLEAGESSIEIGDNCNIQDNSCIDASRGPVLIRTNTTLGHNVRVRSCRVGRRCLVGMGSDLAEGTVLDDDVLLAAGSVTLGEQRLQGGWLWGGRPAKPLFPLNDARREDMQKIIDQYQLYGREYRLAQDRRRSASRIEAAHQAVRCDVHPYRNQARSS